jgi:rubrerythrin
MARLRKCAKCGELFEGEKEQRLCPACRAAEMAKPRMIEHTCPTCDAVFIGGHRATYCPACRLERQKESSRRSRAAQRAGTAQKIGSTVICQRCGNPYILSSPNQKYCPVCGPIALREKVLPYKREYARDRSAERAANKARLKENGTICVVCGKPFTPTTATNVCSEACLKERNRRLQHEADLKRRPRKKKQNAE